jgi:hypothetical protein
MNMITTKPFRSGNSEAILLPKQSIKEMIANLRALPKPDYVQEREPFEAPERDGL